MKISKTHTTLFFEIAQFPPGWPVHFVTIFIFIPPKLSNGIHHLQTPLGTRNTDIAYTGIACATNSF
jgi:hypothetical protein